MYKSGFLSYFQLRLLFLCLVLRFQDRSRGIAETNEAKGRAEKEIKVLQVSHNAKALQRGESCQLVQIYRLVQTF